MDKSTGASPQTVLEMLGRYEVVQMQGRYRIADRRQMPAHRQWAHHASWLFPSTSNQLQRITMRNNSTIVWLTDQSRGITNNNTFWTTYLLFFTGNFCFLTGGHNSLKPGSPVSVTLSKMILYARFGRVAHCAFRDAGAHLNGSSRKQSRSAKHCSACRCPIACPR